MDIALEKQHNMPRQVSGKTAVLASIAGLMIGSPLLGLMGISFTATMTLLLVTTPLFIIFFPVLFGVACVLGLVMVGLAAAGAMAVAGVSTVAWAFRSATSGRAVQFYSDKLIEGGAHVEGETGKDWAGYIQQKPYHPTREDTLINRA